MGQLRSGPLLVGQIGSGFQVSASLQKFCFKNVATFWGGGYLRGFFSRGRESPGDVYRRYLIESISVSQKPVKLVSLFIYLFIIYYFRVGANDGNRVMDGRCRDVSGYHDNEHSDALHHGNDRADVLGVRRRTTNSHAGHNRRLTDLDGHAAILKITV